MIIGLIVIWISLIIYAIALFRQKKVAKKERKWIFLLIGMVMVLSLLDTMHISLNFVTSFLNDSFGKISEMGVNQ